MGAQPTDLAVVTPLAGLTVEDTVTLTTPQATGRLLEFALTNGFDVPEFARVLDRFAQAALQPGVELTFPTVYDLAEMAAARRDHAFMDAVTRDPVAAELAVRATGAMPGSHFVHRLRGDACKLTLDCTNAPNAA